MLETKPRANSISSTALPVYPALEPVSLILDVSMFQAGNGLLLVHKW